MAAVKNNLKQITLLFFSLTLSLNLMAADYGIQPTSKIISSDLKQKLVSHPKGDGLAVIIYLKDKGINLDKQIKLYRKNANAKSLKRRTINRGESRQITFSDLAISEEYFNKIKENAIRVRHKLKWLNAISAEVTPSQIDKLSKLAFVKKIEAINKLKREPEIEFVKTDKRGTQRKAINHTKTEKKVQNLDYGPSLIQNEQIKVPEVHALGYTGAGIVIAVFDSGFNRLTHEVFNQTDIAGTWDFVNNDSDVGDQSDMGNGTHGTNTLSTIGGFSEGNLIGPAYGATFYLAKTENTESELHIEEDNWCAAAEWADEMGANIITSSLGYKDFDSGGDYATSDLDGATTIVTKCAELAADAGILVINSAGNSGDGTTTIGAPADGNQVLAVGAINSTGSRVSFSSVGPSADGRIKPDVMAQGLAVQVASANSDTEYSSVNGTSFSCPSIVFLAFGPRLSVVAISNR